MLSWKTVAEAALGSSLKECWNVIGVVAMLDTSKGLHTNTRKMKVLFEDQRAFH